MFEREGREREKREKDKNENRSRVGFSMQGS